MDNSRLTLLHFLINPRESLFQESSSYSSSGGHDWSKLICGPFPELCGQGLGYSGSCLHICDGRIKASPDQRVIAHKGNIAGIYSNS